MAILQFQKPEKVIVNSTTDNYGQFEFRPQIRNAKYKWKG